MNHPTGTVTFLFMDIQGSTRLWQENPDAMSRRARKPLGSGIVFGSVF